MRKWAYALMFFLYGLIGLESTKEQLRDVSRDAGAAEHVEEPGDSDS